MAFSHFVSFSRFLFKRMSIYKMSVCTYLRLTHTHTNTYLDLFKWNIEQPKPATRRKQRKIYLFGAGSVQSGDAIAFRHLGVSIATENQLTTHSKNFLEKAFYSILCVRFDWVYLSNFFHLIHFSAKKANKHIFFATTNKYTLLSIFFSVFDDITLEAGFFFVSMSLFFELN